MTEPIHVLHVDDDPAFADLVETFLSRADDRLVVDSTTSTERGLDRLASGPVDCVVSDYEMPDRDGISFLEAVRDRYDDLPFILFTGKGSEEIASDAISAGVTDYLRKGRGAERYEILAHRISNAVAAHRSRAESERRRKRLEGILRTVPGCVTQLDTDGQFVFANDRAREILGLERSTVTDRAYNDPEWRIRDVNGDPIPDEELPLRRVLDTGEPVYGYQHTIQWTDGTEKVLVINGVPMTDADDAVDGVLFSLTDVTERRERERTLTQTQRRLDSILENTTAPMFLKDTDGKYVLVNRGYTDLFGMEEADVIGHTDDEIHPAETVREVQRNDRWVLDHERPLTTEERVVVDGEERVFLASKVPIYEGNDERPTAVFGVAKDITEREAYRTQLERQNELLEEFAGVVSHDLRGPLSVAQGRIELAAAERDSAHLDGAATALDRSQELIDEVLRLARTGAATNETEPVALADALTECWQTVETGGATLAVETERTILTDRSRLQQLLQNLVQNAVEHAAPNPTLTVGDSADGFYVADDGPGIPAAEREHVFAPGYSTVDGNTGYGLQIVAQVAADHGWSVAVTESETGGARFDVTGVERGTE